MDAKYSPFGAPHDDSGNDTAGLVAGRPDAALVALLAAAGAAPPPPLVAALELLPDAFVLTDDNFDIVAGNGAFLDLIGLSRPADLIGQPVGRWLGRAGLDLAAMITTLREQGVLSGFATLLRTGGAGEAVDVSAVSYGDANARRHGFSIRPAARVAAARAAASLPLEQLTDLVGRVPMRDIVREATDLIERLCIEAALNHSADNRANAAEMLGLSQQSLHAKLHRHGLGALGDTTSDP